MMIIFDDIQIESCKQDSIWIRADDAYIVGEIYTL